MTQKLKGEQKNKMKETYEDIQCPTCKRVGCWEQDEEDDFIICKCGQDKEK